MVHFHGARVGNDAVERPLLDDVRLDEVKACGTTGVISNLIEIVEGTTRHDEAVHLNPLRHQ
jgi:hypothetical protein